MGPGAEHAGRSAQAKCTGRVAAACALQARALWWLHRCLTRILGVLWVMMGLLLLLLLVGVV